jgi:hypothetical protein
MILPLARTPAITCEWEVNTAKRIKTHKQSITARHLEFWYIFQKIELKQGAGLKTVTLVFAVGYRMSRTNKI